MVDISVFLDNIQKLCKISVKLSDFERQKREKTLKYDQKIEVYYWHTLKKLNKKRRHTFWHTAY